MAHPLQVLHLGFNQISDVPALNLESLRQLRVLHLQGNDIARLDGVSQLHELRELNLDRNRIRALDPGSLAGLSLLRELRIEENGLRSLEHISAASNLATLALGSNRISDLAELEKLTECAALQSLALANNPVARRQLYRPSLVRRMLSLHVIDGREISPEERARTEAMYSAEARAAAATQAHFTQAHHMAHHGAASEVRSYAAKVPLKLTSMNFDQLALGGADFGGGSGGAYSGLVGPAVASGYRESSGQNLAMAAQQLQRGSLGTSGFEAALRTARRVDSGGVRTGEGQADYSSFREYNQSRRVKTGL